MLHLKWFVTLQTKVMIKNGCNRTFIWRKWICKSGTSGFIQIILSVTKITEEDGCSLPCQWGHPGHKDAHPGQHCAAPPGDEDTANWDVLWQLSGDTVIQDPLHAHHLPTQLPSWPPSVPNSRLSASPLQSEDYMCHY